MTNPSERNANSHKGVRPDWTDEKYVRMVQGLLPSGSGGGDFFTNVADLYEHFFPGSFETVYGTDSYMCLGVPSGTRAATIFGGDVRLVVDAIGVFKDMLLAPPTGAIGLTDLGSSIALGTGGAVDLILGRATAIHYGIKRDFHRGPNYEFHTDFKAEGALPAKIVAALIGAMTFSAAILAGVYPDDTAWEHSLAKYGLGAIPDRILAILIDLETKQAVAEMAAEKVAAAQEKADLAPNLAIKLTPGILKSTKADLKSSVDLAVAAANALAESAPNRNIAVDGNYTVRAQNISFTGKPPPQISEDEPDGIFGASSITINALGNMAEENGSLIMTASKQASMSAGSSKVQVVRAADVGTAIVDAGPSGTVNVQQGLPDLGSRMALAPSGITINVGPAPGGASIQMTTEGITLLFGAAGSGPSIKMSAGGIVLSFGSSTLTMNAQGITQQVASSKVAVSPAAVQTTATTVESKGQTTNSVGGAQVNIQGNAQVAITAALTKIG